MECGALRRGPARHARMPAVSGRAGLNLLTSCPSGGVLVTGGDLEALSVWYGGLQGVALRHHSPSPITLRHRFAVPPRMATPWESTRRCRYSARSHCGRAPAAVSQSRHRQRRRAAAGLGAVPPGAGEPARLPAATRSRSPSSSRPSEAAALPGWTTCGASTMPRPGTTCLLCSSLIMLYGDAPPPACRP